MQMNIMVSQHNTVYSKNKAMSFSWKWLAIIRPNYKNMGGGGGVGGGGLQLYFKFEI
jgi:hypothetical protein